MTVAGMIPISIQAEESARISVRKESHTETVAAFIREERAVSLRKWQERWDNSSKGRWTYTLIPNIEKWVNRKHGEVNFHLTQFLTGHGVYRSYLHRFGHDNSPLCPVCSVVEDACHVVFDCPRFDALRTELADLTNTRPLPQNIVDIMLTSESAWNSVCYVIATINKLLREEDNMRRSVLQTASVA